MYVYGKNVARDLIKNNKKIRKVLIWDGFSDENIILSLRKLQIPIKYLSKNEISQLAKGNHQGIILDIPDYTYLDLDEIKKSDKEFPLLVMLDHIEDPHNLGAIIRTCESAGVDGIIIPKDRSVEINSTVMKTSAGALDRVKICKVTNLANAIDELKKDGYWIIGTDLSGEDYSTIDYKMKICLIIGNEGKGMSKLIKEKCDFLATIPMKGEVNSLNASVATGIMIYEILEKRK